MSQISRNVFRADLEKIGVEIFTKIVERTFKPNY